MLLIGTDEAGYGPNLGPLTITATCWRYHGSLPMSSDPLRVLSDSLCSALADCVCEDRPDDSHLHVADSKKVYSSGRSPLQLERTALSFCRAAQLPISDFEELTQALDSFGYDLAVTESPWFPDRDTSTAGGTCRGRLPFWSEAGESDDFGDRINQALAAENWELVCIRSRALFATEFNRLLEAAGSKGRILTAETLGLIRACTDRAQVRIGSDQAIIVCDKHGGRNRYDDAVSAAFDDAMTFRIQESRGCSRYRIGNAEFRFETKAERYMPVATASIVSKYLREGLMKYFNEFWQRHLPDLRPTAGYPLDAKRFFEQILPLTRDLQIEPDRLWRRR